MKEFAPLNHFAQQNIHSYAGFSHGRLVELACFDQSSFIQHLAMALGKAFLEIVQEMNWSDSLQKFQRGGK